MVSLRINLSSYVDLLFLSDMLIFSGNSLFDLGIFMSVSEKAMAPHSSTLAWKIPWMREPGSCSPWGCEESYTTAWLHFHFSLSCIGEGNGNPLQCSCLENPRDGGAWWAAVYGVAQSRTRLKRLSSMSASSACTFLLWTSLSSLSSLNSKWQGDFA